MIERKYDVGEEDGQENDNQICFILPFVSSRVGFNSIWPSVGSWSRHKCQGRIARNVRTKKKTK